MLDHKSAQERLARYGQAHLLRFWDELNEQQRLSLLEQLEAIDLDWLERALAADEERLDPAAIEPYEDVIGPAHPDGPRAVELGQKALRQGRLGVLLVAGGQGTRLGFDGPKGAFPIGPVSGASLFQIHIERLLAAGQRHGEIPPLYLMTSPQNHQQTVDFLEQNERFGIAPERLFVFQQGQAPAVDEAGKLLMASPWQLILSANGNGGAFAALKHSGALDHMLQLGVDQLSYIHVDNPLVPSCDARFLGFHLMSRGGFSCKAIPKVGPDERVGSFARAAGRLRVVEYFELPREMARQRDASGVLRYGLSNPGIYLWSREFVEAQAARDDLPWHRAHKRLPHIDDEGRRVQPEAPNGYKLEAFAMDTLPGASGVLMAVDRQSQFAPVKNARGEDSPESARQLMTRLHRAWLLEAGGQLKRPDLQVEVSPLYAEDAAALALRLPPGELKVHGDLYLAGQSSFGGTGPGTPTWFRLG